MHRPGALPSRHSQDPPAERAGVRGRRGPARHLQRSGIGGNGLDARLGAVLLHVRGHQEASRWSDHVAARRSSHGRRRLRRSDGVPRAGAVRSDQAACPDGATPVIVACSAHDSRQGRHLRFIPWLLDDRAARDPVLAHSVSAVGILQEPLGSAARPRRDGLAVGSVRLSRRRHIRLYHDPAGRRKDARHAGRERVSACDTWTAACSAGSVCRERCARAVCRGRTPSNAYISRRGDISWCI